MSDVQPSAPDSKHSQCTNCTAVEWPRVIVSDDLLHGEREIHIRHGDHLYRLRVTKAGKLILNK